jgi:hypothetical protein
MIKCLYLSEMEQFLLILVETGLLSETNLMIKKEELRICLLKNQKRLPHITQYQLGHALLSCGFVEPENVAGTYKVSKNKLEALLDRREHDSHENRNFYRVFIVAPLLILLYYFTLQRC